MKEIYKNGQKNRPIEIGGVLYYKCKKCGEMKELTEEFWRRESKVLLGFNSTCKECHKHKDKYYREKNIDKIRERGRRYMNRYRKEHPERIREYNIWYKENFKDIIKIRQKKYREEHRDEIREKRRDVRNRGGRERRGKRLQKNRNTINAKNRERNINKQYEGIHRRTAWLIHNKLIRPTKCTVCGYEGQIVAHHPDYSKEKEVVFCCQSCHRLIHLGKITVNNSQITNLADLYSNN